MRACGWFGSQQEEQKQNYREVVFDIECGHTLSRHNLKGESHEGKTSRREWIDGCIDKEQGDQDGRHMDFNKEMKQEPKGQTM